MDGDLLVADSYNHRVKRIDPRTAKVDPMYGTGRPGADDGALNEPGGIAVAEKQVYIADTNNHRIVVVSPDQGASRTLDIRLPDQDRASAPPARGAAGAHTFTVAVSLPEGAEFTEGAPYEVRLRGTGGVAVGDYDAATPRDRVEAPVMVSGPGEVDVETAIYYCDATDPDLCGVVARAYRIAVELATAGESGWELRISLPPLR